MNTASSRPDTDMKRMSPLVAWYENSAIDDGAHAERAEGPCVRSDRCTLLSPSFSSSLSDDGIAAFLANPTELTEHHFISGADAAAILDADALDFEDDMRFSIGSAPNLSACSGAISSGAAGPGRGESLHFYTPDLGDGIDEVTAVATLRHLASTAAPSISAAEKADWCVSAPLVAARQADWILSVNWNPDYYFRPRSAFPGEILQRGGGLEAGSSASAAPPSPSRVELIRVRPL
jgi:hypothetical protein